MINIHEQLGDSPRQLELGDGRQILGDDVLRKAAEMVDNVHRQRGE